MRILFVCRANVGRSQMAEALFNKLSRKHMADSAGTSVDKEGQTIADFATIKPSAENVVAVMDNKGLDVRLHTRKQLNEKMLNEYDKIIVLASPHECPQYLINNPLAVFWNVDDAAGTDHSFHVKTRDAIKALIVELLEKIE